MQISISLTTKTEMRHAWAFAVRKRRFSRHPLRHSVITACSKQAKEFGVQAGMRYEDARALVPGLRILVYGTGGTYDRQ